jgi:hypothetical protein
MRITAIAAGVFTDFGIPVPIGTTVDLPFEYAKSLVRALKASDTDGVLPPSINQPFSVSPLIPAPVSGAGIAQQVSRHASGRASSPVSTFNGASSSGVLGKPDDIPLPVLVDGKSRIKLRFMVRKTGTDAASYCQLHIGPANGLADPNVLSGSTGTQFASSTPYPALYELELHYKSGGFQITGNRFVSGVGQTPISWEFTGTFVNDGNAKLNVAITGATAGNTYDLVFLDADVQVFT